MYSFVPLVLCTLTFVVTAAPLARAATPLTNNLPPGASALSATNDNRKPIGGVDLLRQPLSLTESLNLALQHNSTIQKAKSDVQASEGIIIQTRAVALPRISTGASYELKDKSSIEQFPFGDRQTFGNDQNWTGEIRLTQSIYEGGRITSALRSTKFTREQSIQRYEAAVADVLLQVRIAYDDVLLGEQLIAVQEASVKLLLKELEDTRRRFEAGTVPRFNVLRAEVEVGNARPRLIRAKNAYRIAKNNLINLVGFDLPNTVWEDIPLVLTDKLTPQPFSTPLPEAIVQAMQNRPELQAFRAAIQLRRESVITARAGYKPSVQLVGGYRSRNSSFVSDLTADVSGWFTGAQMNWNIFDGQLTRGRVRENEALVSRAMAELEEATRNIELEVRTAYSNVIEAQEVLDSQKKVQEQAEEALRLANARSEAGSGTQLDVLNAQTSLTEARTTQIQALRDYSVALARLERSLGQKVETKK